MIFQCMMFYINFINVVVNCYCFSFTNRVLNMERIIFVVPNHINKTILYLHIKTCMKCSLKHYSRVRLFHYFPH